jgi:hypothetical protein
MDCMPKIKYHLIFTIIVTKNTINKLSPIVQVVDIDVLMVENYQKTIHTNVEPISLFLYKIYDKLLFDDKLKKLTELYNNELKKGIDVYDDIDAIKFAADQLVTIKNAIEDSSTKMQNIGEAINSNNSNYVQITCTP